MNKTNFTARHLPADGPRWVQCNGYRCLAFLNKDGQWMVYATGKELPDFIRVCGAGDEPEKARSYSGERAWGVHPMDRAATDMRD
jgi:hypothetical protein